MPPVGSIVRALQDAQSDRLLAERLCEELLIDLFSGWAPKFPRHLGWLWTEPATLDVWNVIEYPAALAALRLAGFNVATLHDHPVARPLRCACPKRKI